MSSWQANLVVSLKISISALLLVVLIGGPVAWWLSKPRGGPLQRAVDILVNLPLALPPTVIGYFLLIHLGRDGLMGRLVATLGGSPLIFTPTAAVIASGIVALPLFVQGTRVALEGIAPEVYEAARVDGATRGHLLLWISIPLSWHGICSGLLLAFTRSLGEFGATMMVAGNIPGRTQTMALAIYSAVQAGHDHTARMLTFILTTLAVVSMALGLRWRSIPARVGTGFANHL